MRKRQQRLVRAWLITADILAAAMALPVAFHLRFHSGLFDVPLGQPPFDKYAALLPFIAVLWPAVFAFQRLYRPARRAAVDELFTVALGVTTASLLLFGLDAYWRVYATREIPPDQRFQFSRLFILLFVAVDFAFTLAGRGLVRGWLAQLRRRGLHLRRVLIAGAGELLGERVARTMGEHPESGYRVVGFVDDDPAKKGARLGGVAVLGTTDDIHGLIVQERVDELLLALPWSAHDRMLEILRLTSREYIEIKFVPDLLEYVAIRAGLEDLDGVPVLNLSEDSLHTWDWMLKRVFDVAVAATGLVLLAPVFAVTAWLVRRSSPGPVFYAQERMGLDGRRFTMYKFRTMQADAEAESGPVFAADEDPRCTPLGRWLRRLFIDELPQLWNVLRGEMSVVGPRPERQHFVEEFKKHVPQYMLRHRVKSGMTGWAQVNGWRGNTSIPKRIEHDIYYITNWSLALDLKIVWLTLLRAITEPSRAHPSPL